MNTKKLWAFTGLTLVAAGLALPAARAQGPRTVYLYNASLGSAPASVSGAKFGPWGNGEIKPTRQRVEYEGAGVVEVTTKNFAEGARFDFKTPVNIDSYQAKGFVRLRLKFAEDRNARGGRAGGNSRGGDGARGGMINSRAGGGVDDGGADGGGMDDGGAGGGGMDGGGGGDPRTGGRFQNNDFSVTEQSRPQTLVNAQFGATGALPPIGGGFDPRMGGGMGMGGGMDGGMGGDVGPAPQKTDITAIRVTLMRQNGALTGIIPIDLEAITPDEGGWRLFVLPISDMKQTPGASGPVQRMVLTSDQQDTFFLAQAALVVETGDMDVSIRPTDAAEGAQLAEVTVKPGPVTLIADVEAGAADPQVEWNFDADNVGNFPPPGGDPNGMDGGMTMGGDPRRGGMTMGGDPRMGGMTMGGDPRMGGGMGMDGEVAMDGPRVDARGLTATFTYPNEEQNYRVEVTVTDKSGKKEPVKTSILVKVRN